MVAQALAAEFTKDEIIGLLDESFDAEEPMGLYYKYDSEKDVTTLGIQIQGNWSPTD